MKTAIAQGKVKKPVKKIEEMKVYGSVYEYYYGGYSQTKITDKVSNSTTKFNNQDQSLLQSAFDITGCYRKDEYDAKVVVRGTQTTDLLATSDDRRNISRLRALYLEHSSQDSYFVRGGCQPGNTGGVLDFRFDGVWYRYTAVPQFLNVNFLARQPRQFSLASNYVPDDPRSFLADVKRYFYGVNVDIGPVAKAWSGNTYFINQMVNGVIDRRAVGTELRYAENGKNAFGLVDYDLSYNVLNVAMLNGTLRERPSRSWRIIGARPICRPRTRSSGLLMPNLNILISPMPISYMNKPRRSPRPVIYFWSASCMQ